MHWLVRWAVVACSWGPLLACGDDEPLAVGTRADADGGANEPAPPDDSAAPEPGGDEEPEADDDFDLSDSEVIERLQDEETVAALCSLAGVLMVSQGGATEQECNDAVERCTDGFAVVRDAGTQTAPGSVPSDLSGVFDCPATAQLVDACLSELVVLASDLGDELSCEAAASAGFDVSQLTGAVSCAVLYLTCPDVFSSILGADAGPLGAN